MPKSMQIPGTRSFGVERSKSGTRITRRDVLAGAAAWAVLPPLTLSTRAAADFFQAAALEKVAGRDPSVQADVALFVPESVIAEVQEHLPTIFLKRRLPADQALGVFESVSDVAWAILAHDPPLAWSAAHCTSRCDSSRLSICATYCDRRIE